MSQAPLVSVVLPIYKVEQWLRRGVDSVLAQTFRDFELILVDDGSPDNCGVICDEYAAADPRVRVIHQKNQGVSRARNVGIEQARGRWLVFLDPDDVASPWMLEAIVTAAEKYPRDCIIWRFTPFPSTVFEPVHESPETLYAPDQIGFLYLDWKLCAPWSMLYSVDLLRRTGHRFDTTLRHSEDFPFVFHYARLVFEDTPGSRFVYLESPLYFYDNEDKGGSSSHVVPAVFCEGWCRTFQMVFRDVDEFFHIPQEHEHRMYQNCLRTLGSGLASRLDVSPEEQPARRQEALEFLDSPGMKEILDTFRRRHYCSPFYGPLRRRRLGAIQRLGRLYEKRHSRYLSLQQKYNRVNRLFFGTAY